MKFEGSYPKSLKKGKHHTNLFQAVVFAGISGSCKEITFMLLTSADVKVPQFYLITLQALYQQMYTTKLLYCVSTLQKPFNFSHFQINYSGIEM